MGKALGLLACTTLVAVTYWSISDGRHTNRASAGDERFDAGRSPSDSSDSRAAGYKTVAARLMDQARELASKGDIAGARTLAKRANTFPVQWKSNEQTPEQLLKLLDPGTAASRRRADVAGSQADRSSAPTAARVAPANRPRRLGPEGL